MANSKQTFLTEATLRARVMYDSLARYLEISMLYGKSTTGWGTAFKVDQGQGHYHQVAVDTTGGLGTASISGASSVVEGYATDGTRGPVADGTNGTPRTGKETNPKQVGVYYLVKLYDNLAAADVYIAPASGTTPGLLERFQEGTYQPTISNQTNCETSTPGTFTLRYHRFNNLVLVFGQLSVDFINAANTTTYFDMTLPIASTLANTYDVAGILGGGATTQNITPFSVTKQSASTVRVSGSSTTGANNAVWSLFFMYQIL